MGFICIFVPCKWIHVTQGIYQCARCKTISIGANKDQSLKKEGQNGCYHTSNKNLKVTAMGDTDEWYLCESCGEKVKESELND